MRSSSLFLGGLLVVATLQPAFAGNAKTKPVDNSGSDVCVGVSIDGSALDNFSCLNAHLRQSAIAAKDRADQSLSLEGGAANAPPSALNVFNETATHERLGDAFGHSAIPQRPQKTYSNPLISGR
jgi:hypothetical protein